MSGSEVQVGGGDFATEQYTEVEYQGVWVPLPLVPQSRITRSPMSPFSPAIQRGNSQRVVDQRLNVMVWDDWQGGFGYKKAGSDEASNRYWHGNWDTRSKNALVLPPGDTAYGQITASTIVPPVMGFSARRPDGLKNYLVFGPQTSGLHLRNGSTGVWSAPASLSAMFVHDVVSFRGALYAHAINSTSQSYIYKSTDQGATWTTLMGGAAGWYGVTVLDTRIFSYNLDGKVYASADGTTFTAASESWFMDYQEVVKQIFTAPTPDGASNTVYVLTNYQVKILEEEPGFWHDYFSFDGVIDTTMPRAHVWRRTNSIYVTFFSNATDNQGQIVVLRGGTSDEVGPRSMGGTPEDHFISLSHTFGNVHELFTWGVGGQYYTEQGTLFDSKGRLMSMDELGQWHTIADGAKMGLTEGESYVTGGWYDNQVVYAILKNGRVYGYRVPDRKLLHPLKENRIYSTRQHKHYSSIENGGLKNVWKVGAYFLVDAELEDGSHGAPLGSTIGLRYRMDGGTWVQLPQLGATESVPLGLLLSLQTIKSSGSVYPAVIPLPNGAEQWGAPFKDVQWELTGQKTLTGNTPVITEVSLYYSLWLEQFFSYQFNVDFTLERWTPDSTWRGYDREGLMKLLDEIQQHKGYLRFRFGYGPRETIVPAADMLVAYRLEPNGGAVAQVSLRDLTAVKLPG